MYAVLQLAAVVAAAAMVTGKPHHNCPLDDYAKAVLAQYYPAAAAEPMALEYEEVAQPPCRSGRSNDSPPTPMPPPPTPTPSHLVATACAKTAPGVNNDTSSAATVEKLAEYYDRLKGQQEALVRDQLQRQLYEQQQRRQQEFAAALQQMQQQYYQQQQHALLMLEQLRKNPAFVGQLAAFGEHRPANGTVAPAPAPAAAVVAASHHRSAPDEKDQVIGNHAPAVDKDAAEDDGGGAKRLEARQAVRDDEAREPELSSPDCTADDDLTPPVLEKVYSVTSD